MLRQRMSLQGQGYAPSEKAVTCTFDECQVSGCADYGVVRGPAATWFCRAASNESGTRRGPDRLSSNCRLRLGAIVGIDLSID